MDRIEWWSLIGIGRPLSLISVSYSFLFLFFSVMRLCVTGPPVFFFFFLIFFFFLCVGACLGDLKISRLVYLCKACLRLEYLGKESDSMLSEFLKGQKKNWRLLKCRFEVIFLKYYFGFCDIVKN